MEFPATGLPSLPSINFPIVLTQNVLMIFLFVFGIFYITISSILFYHWVSYGMGGRGIHIGETLYSVVSVLFFIVAFLAVSYY